MPLSDKEQAEFADMVQRLGTSMGGRGKWKMKRLSRLALAGFIVGLVEMLMTFTWNIPLGLVGVLVMGASAWTLAVFVPHSKAHQMSPEDLKAEAPH